MTAFSPAGFWTPAELRFCQLSLAALARHAAACCARRSRRSRARAPGASRCSRRPSATPRGCPREEAVATLRDAWASPAFAGALAAFDDYRFGAPEQLRDTPVTIAWGKRDRLLPYRLQAPRARAMLPWATHVTLGAGHVPFYDDPAAVAEVIRARARSVATAAAQRR